MLRISNISVLCGMGLERFAFNVPQHSLSTYKIDLNPLLPKIEFFFALEFILNFTFFLFNDKFYKQTFGTPMGSPLSPIIADLIQELELEALNNLSIQSLFYVRYVDDIALAFLT